MFDVATISFGLSVASALSCVFAWILYLNQKSTPGTSTIAISNTMFLVGFGFVTLRPWISAHLSFVAANACIFVGYGLFLHCIRQFYGFRNILRYIMVAFVLYIAEFSYFFYVENAYNIRLFFYLATHGVIMIFAFLIIIRGRGVLRVKSYKSAAMFVGLSSIVSIIGAISALIISPEGDVLKGSAINSAVLLDQFVFNLGWTFSFTLMVNERIYNEKLQAEKALIQYARTLKDSNRELEQFSYAVSHDIQEPLRNVASYAQLIHRRYKGRLDDNADEFIDFLVGGVHRMKEMITDLLEYSRIDGTSEAFEVTNLNDALTAAMINLKDRIAESGAKVEAGNLPNVYGASRQLESLFQNLVGNAIKYQPPGQTPIIRIEARAKDDLWEVSVSDNGIGIAPEYLTTIFDPFRRLHRSSRRQHLGGTGSSTGKCV